MSSESILQSIGRAYENHRPRVWVEDGCDCTPRDAPESSLPHVVPPPNPGPLPPPPFPGPPPPPPPPPPAPTFCNTEQSYTAECPEGETGDPVTVTKEAGSLCGFASQAEADAAALAIATSEAIAALDCSTPTFCNTEQSFTADCPEGTTGDSVTITIPEGSLCDYATQEEADAAALAQAQEEAEAALECEEEIVCTCPEGLSNNYTVGDEITGSPFTICRSDAECLWCGYSSADSEDRAKVVLALDTEDVGGIYGMCHWNFVVNDGVVIGYKTYDSGDPTGEYRTLGDDLVGVISGGGEDCISCEDTTAYEVITGLDDDSNVATLNVAVNSGWEAI